MQGAIVTDDCGAISIASAREVTTTVAARYSTAPSDVKHHTAAEREAPLATAREPAVESTPVKGRPALVLPDDLVSDDHALRRSSRAGRFGGARSFGCAGTGAPLPLEVALEEALEEAPTRAAQASGHGHGDPGTDPDDDDAERDAKATARRRTWKNGDDSRRADAPPGAASADAPPGAAAPRRAPKPPAPRPPSGARPPLAQSSPRRPGSAGSGSAARLGDERDAARPTAPPRATRDTGGGAAAPARGFVNGRRTKSANNLVSLAMPVPESDELSR